MSFIETRLGAKVPQPAQVKKQSFWTGMSMTFVLLIAGVISLFVVGLGNTGLFDVDEAIFAQASVEMMDSGDYVTPTYNGEPRYHKPPLIYWLQAFSMSIFGIGALGARLPSAICGIVTVFMFYNVVSQLSRSNRYALIGASVLGFNLSFLMVARAAIADMVLNMFMLALTLMLVGNVLTYRRHAFPLIIAGFVMGLGLLAKGPIAAVVPGVIVLMVVLLRPQVGYNFRCADPFVIVPAAFLGLIPWAVHLTKEKGFDFLREFIMVHNIGRYTETMGNHSGHWHYYLVVLLIGFFPWVLFLPSAVTGRLSTFWKDLRGDSPRDALPVIGFLWMVFVLVLFSFSATKLPHYVLFALPGAALLVADRLDKLAEKPLLGVNWLWMWPYMMAFALLFLLLPYLPEFALRRGDLYMAVEPWLAAHGWTVPAITDAQVLVVLRQKIDWGVAPAMIGAIMLIGFSMSMIMMTRGMRQGAMVMAVTMWMSLMLTVMGVVPTVYAYMQEPLARIAQEIKQVYNPDTDKVVFYSLHQPSVRFISGVPFVPKDSAASAVDVKAKRLMVVLEEEKLDSLNAQLGMGSKRECFGGYCLVKIGF
ncbi:MAG: phospholipid carrier-dependent glycosyltransferase [Proteobacteria bacterium]|nr:phospholipid carrier-dependent glycosyltransferase [Pseudomonadota bacterium]